MSGLSGSRVRVVAGDRLILDGVDVSIPSGSLTALVGPNGAGKSTLLRALAAIDLPREGSVHFDEADLLAMPRRSRARILALVEQDTATELALSVAAVVALGRVPHESIWQAGGEASARAVESALETVEMSGFADREFGSLSGGERQRVMLAKAIAQDPRLLLLDEPTNHLDIAAQLSALVLLGNLARQGVTVLAALHDLNLAAGYCDRVIVLAGGRVVAAGPTAVTLTPRLIAEVYGVDAAVLSNPSDGRAVIAFTPRGRAPEAT